jgi:lysophospholipase L1-like esterase
MKEWNLLCLGDSYTIGEGVPLHQSFPYQTIQLLRKQNIHFSAPEIIAQTGWTSFELINHLETIKLLPSYNFVTLLIGVNNQYRGLTVASFEKEFTQLLHLAIAKANGVTKNVIVLSIPDWGVTPFAADKEATKIANEINTFNGVCELVAQKNQTHFIEITNSTRQAKNDVERVTIDGLHYSQKEMANWSSLVANYIKTQIS